MQPPSEETLGWLIDNQFSRGERFAFSQNGVAGEADRFLLNGETAIVLLFDTGPARPIVDVSPQAMAIITLGLRPFDAASCLWGYDDRLDPEGLVYLFRFFQEGNEFVQRPVGVLPRLVFYALLDDSEAGELEGLAESARARA